MTELLNWYHKIVDVPERGLKQTRQASDEERERVAQWLKIPSVGRLATNYRITGLAGGGYRLTGDVEAEVTQQCVITLGPVAGRVNDQFDVEFWPPSTNEGDEANEIGALDAVEIENIENGRIDAGRIVVETLSAALDPYPRHPDAAYAPARSLDENDEAELRDNPFSILSRLKDKS